MIRYAGTHIQYADWVEKISASFPYNNGRIAPPAIAIMIIAEAVFVNLPRPFIVIGHSAGHISEFARPIKATKRTVKGKTSFNGEKVTISINGIVKVRWEGLIIAARAKITPRIAQIFNAVTCLIYFGISIIPRRYPIIMLSNVREVKYFAELIAIPSDWPYLMIVSAAITSTPT